MINISNLHKSFGTQHVLKGIDLSIERGETISVVGPSGTGKSVLLKIITGLMRLDGGSLSLFEIPMSSATPVRQRNELYRRMGILFQGAALIDSLTLFENLAFPLRWRKDLKEKAIVSLCNEKMREVGLTGNEHFMPQQVPIGVRKRLGIARALITEPDLILFDEPNTSLDPVVGQEIYDLIKEIQTTMGITGIVISHEIPEVFQICRRVVMLYNGLVQFDGSVEEFRSSSDPVVSQFVTGNTEGPI